MVRTLRKPEADEGTLLEFSLKRERRKLTASDKARIKQNGKFEEISLPSAASLINDVARKLFHILLYAHGVFLDFIQYTLVRVKNGEGTFSVDCLAEVGEAAEVWWLELKWTRGPFSRAKQSIRTGWQSVEVMQRIVECATDWKVDPKLRSQRLRTPTRC